MRFPFYKQPDTMDCGPTCIKMITKYYGKSLSLQWLRDKCFITREGVSLLNISEVFEGIGFRTLAVKTSLEELYKEAHLPCIVHWAQNHFLIICKIKKKSVWVADPAKGMLKYSRADFLNGWGTPDRKGEKVTGIALLLEPTPVFYHHEDNHKKNALDLRQLFSYFIKYKKLFAQLSLGLLAGSVLQLILPFFAQSIVDVGIATKDISFIYLLLIGQLMLFAGSTLVDFTRSWLLLHISTRVNISLMSDFLIKLMKLPLSFFDAKMLGDIMQRIGDHRRVESFLTGTSINLVFSLINFIAFTFIAIIYDLNLFIIFLVGSILYFSWIFAFMRYRRALDFKQFDISARNQSATIQLVNGMQEIKLSNSQQIKRWEWENLQVQHFKIQLKSLTLSQLQQGGAFFINQAKNIVVTFFAAQAVIDGKLTLGGMMAIQYIIGQLNAPVQQFIQFLQSLQDARISLERINEIHQMPDEEPSDRPMIRSLPHNKFIIIKNLHYKYPGYKNDWVLQDINLLIPQGKITAIVGGSGSGKTTLLKLLLKFYENTNGEIRIGDTLLSNISNNHWRAQCGAVMQDGYIFSDSIANNIAVGQEVVDKQRLEQAINIANIQDYIESLPLGYNTKIGADGNGISQGQKQRILIARAVYKDPEYLLFDEATNSLDANNEKVIMEKLGKFLSGRTAIVVAHRLSTVKNAEQIIVMDKGCIVERGTHDELTFKKGNYYRLIKNQLELGN